MTNKSSYYLLIAHGSPEKEANLEFFELLERFRAAVPDKQVEGGFLKSAHPLVPDALEQCILKGAGEIVILPLLFFWGKHVKYDIPRCIEEARSRHPEVDFHYASPVGDHALLLKLLAQKAKGFKQKRPITKGRKK